MNKFHTATATATDVQEFTLLDSIVEQSRIARKEEEHHRAKSLIAELAKEVMAGTITVSENMTLSIDKRIAEIEDEEEFLDMQEELLDRFGDIPTSVNNLLNIALIKSMCHSVYITSMIHKNDQIKLVMYNKAKLRADKFPELIKKYQPALKLTMEANPYFTYDLKKMVKGKIDCITFFENVKNLLNDLKLLLDEEN